MAVSTSYSAKYNAGTLTPRYVVIHGTAGSSDKGDLETLTSGGGRKVSAHVLIGRDGTRYQLLPDTVGANHAGYSNAALAKALPPNRNALSIELSNNQKGEPYTAAQLAALREQLAEWNGTHGTLPIVAHGMLDPKRRSDPVGLDLSGFGTVLDPDKALPTPTMGGTKKKTVTTASDPMVDQIMATIRKRESSNNYASTRKDSKASGAYQFMDSTWQSAAGKEIASKYPRAYMAPPAVQDAVARKEVTRILGENGGDVRAVPMFWFYPAGAKQALAGRDVQPPGPKNPTMLTYLRGWMSDYEKSGGRAGSGSGEAARLSGGSQPAVTKNPMSPTEATSTLPVVGGALGALTSIGQQGNMTMPTQPYVPMTTLPPLGTPQADSQMPSMGNMPQAQTSALNMLLAMGNNGATGRMQVFLDPKTGKLVTRPAGG